MDNVEETIRSFIAENVLFSEDGYPHSDDTSFLDEGIIDSMSVMDLVLHIEQVYEISIKDSEITPDNFDSVRNLAAFVRTKSSGDPESVKEA